MGISKIQHLFGDQYQPRKKKQGGLGASLLDLRGELSKTKTKHFLRQEQAREQAHKYGFL